MTTGVSAERSVVAEWKTAAHLEDHFGRHRGELRVSSIEQYDFSAQQTITIGVRFSYRDPITGDSRYGYYHRETAAFVGCDQDGFIRTHYILDEDDIYGLPGSTYWEE